MSEQLLEYTKPYDVTYAEATGKKYLISRGWVYDTEAWSSSRFMWTHGNPLHAGARTWEGALSIQAHWDAEAAAKEYVPWPWTAHNPESDMVNNPSHYNQAGIEVIDVIEAYAPDSYHLGNVIKYCCRSGHKGQRLQDYKKARWYLDRLIENEEKHEHDTVPDLPTVEGNP